MLAGCYTSTADGNFWRDHLRRPHHGAAASPGQGHRCARAAPEEAPAAAQEARAPLSGELQALLGLITDMRFDKPECLTAATKKQLHMNNMGTQVLGWYGGDVAMAPVLAWKHH